MYAVDACHALIRKTSIRIGVFEIVHSLNSSEILTNVSSERFCQKACGPHILGDIPRAYSDSLLHFDSDCYNSYRRFSFLLSWTYSR